ncbi:MAG: outer membrane protein assembly factor, partial [Leeuwenhoekiella sp.]
MRTKILLILLVLYTLAGCNVVKRVAPGENLLINNTIAVNGEENASAQVDNILYQHPNNKLRLHIFNLARPNVDSILHTNLIENDRKRRFWTSVLSRKQLDHYIDFRESFNQTLKNTGEAPVIISENLSQRSADRLSEYYHSTGWFNAKTTYAISRDTIEKRGSVKYNVTTGKPYIIDSIKTFIKSPKADSLYNKFKNESEIASGNQYKLLDVNAETSRLTTLFRNNGMFHFDREFISFIGDSVNTDHKVNLELYIKNRQIKAQDSVYEEVLKVHKISKVKVYTDYAYSKRDTAPKDTVELNNYEIFAYDKIDYKAKYLTDAIFIAPGDTYSDESRNKSLIRLSQLRTFRYPDLKYTDDVSDPKGEDLIANFYLTPLPKFNLRADFDLSTSNIQKFGVAGGGSLLARNVFGGMETLQLSGRGSIGASATGAKNNDTNSFFDITEIGADLSLTIPRIFFPIKTAFIQPEMSPSTSFTVGVGVQQNIGLDKQNITGGVNYKWTPSTNLNYRFDLFDIQYIRNLNQNNYFNVYSNSYDNLNTIALNNLDPASPYLQVDGNDNQKLIIPEGAAGFTSDVQNGNIALTTAEFNDVSTIEERRQRLTEDNLILATSFTYYKNTRSGLFDNEYTSFRGKLELAGNMLDLVSSVANLDRNADGSSKVLGVTFSQYVKTELDFIKHW